MSDRTVRIVISGRVQGVGYRAWVEERAIERGLAGWVRNRQDGTVEAVFSGDAGEVDAMIAECRRGPPLARVIDIEIGAYAGPALTRFAMLPTA